MKKIDLIMIVCLLLVSSILIFNNLGSSTIYDWDEARHAENALEILKTNEWIVIQYGGKPDLWNLKPPLGAWLIATSFKIFGFTEFALRFWSAFFGIATIVLVYLFGKEIKDRLVGFLSAIVLLLTKGFVGEYYPSTMNWFHGAKTGDYEVILTFFITLSLYSFYLSQKRKENKFLILGGVALGFSFLTKGFIGLFPLGIITIYLLYNNSFKEAIIKKEIKYALISFLAIVSPWLILRLFNGKEFFIKMIEYDLFKRAISPIEGHQGGIFYYVSVLYDGLGPILFILGMLSLIYSILMIKNEKNKSILIIWILFFLVLFTLAKSKIFWYILPAYPAISILIALTLTNLKDIFKIKKIYFAILVVIMLIIPALNSVESSKKVYVDPYDLSIKEIKEGFNQVGDVYINSKENSQSTFFYLNAYSNGNVNVYKNVSEIKIKESEGLVTFNKEEFDRLNKYPDYRLIRSTEYIYLFKKIKS